MNVAKGRGQAGQSWGWASCAQPALWAGLLVLVAGGCFRHHAAAPAQAAPAPERHAPSLPAGREAGPEERTGGAAR